MMDQTYERNTSRTASLWRRCGIAGCTWLASVGLAATAIADNPFTSSDAAYRANDFTVPQTRLQPIGAPSAVDKFRNERSTPQSFPDENVRQAVLMQSSGGFPMPGTGLPKPLDSSRSTGPISLPPSNAFDNGPLPGASGSGASGSSSGSGLPMPNSSSGTLPSNPAINANPQGSGSFAPVPRTGVVGGQAMPGGDYAPMPQPQLGNQFATLGNCRNISAPSGYRSDRILTCGPSTSFVTTAGATSQPPIYSPPPAQIGPPVILPPTQIGVPIGSTQTVIPGPAGYRPLISFGQERYPLQIGQGIFGQPVAYVPGQTFRNALRYIAW